jgi:hypothetical protein
VSLGVWKESAAAVEEIRFKGGIADGAEEGERKRAAISVSRLPQTLSVKLLFPLGKLSLLSGKCTMRQAEATDAAATAAAASVRWET